MSMSYSGEGPSAQHLLNRMKETGPAPDLYTKDTLYYMSVEWTCRLLDAVDEVVDRYTGQQIADVIYGHLTTTGASEAEQRALKTRELLAEYMRAAPPPIPFPFPGEKQPPKLPTGNLERDSTGE